MRLADALLPILPAPGGAVIALVGAGGKTSALFGLGEDLGRAGAPALLTTTTHIFDPRLEAGRGFDRLVLEPALAGPAPAGAACPLIPGDGRRTVLATAAEAGTGKLKGIHPSWAGPLAAAWRWIIVEADGAKRLPVKAPAGHEPVVPEAAGLVLGCVGLGCLGRPMDAATVHRPERFAEATGCPPGAAIGPEHLAALAGSPLGLFRGVPPGARRVLVLNQADLHPAGADGLRADLDRCGPLAVDLVVVCALGRPDPEARVLAAWRPVDATVETRQSGPAGEIGP
jgi:probable selenium-dependent hydroxylase accessory protein YqeC